MGMYLSLECSAPTRTLTTSFRIITSINHLPLIQPPHIHQRPYKLGSPWYLSVARTTISASPIPLLVWHAVAVQVRHERESVRDEVQVRGSHQLGARDSDGAVGQEEVGVVGRVRSTPREDQENLWPRGLEEHEGEGDCCSKRIL